ncbi:MAG: M35 family metallopeptidase [Rhodovarius sp.]|nr:M35 family metallopeptidase [Rhodovarius sp.]
MIETASRDALTRRQRGMARLDAHPELPECRRCFGTGPVAPVGAHLPGIADGLFRHRPLAIFGKLPKACPPGRFGEILRPGGAIGFCPLSFHAGQDGLRSRPGEIVHEVSHIAAGTRDLLSSPTRAAILAKKDLTAAGMNADNDEYVVGSAGRAR